MGVGQQDSGKGRQQNGGEEWDALKDDVSEMADTVAQQGRHFIDSAREQAVDYVERRKDDVAESVADFATSLRESTRSFDDRPNIQAIVDSAAEGLEQLADTIRERSFSDFFNDFEDVVRRRPASVAAVSVAIGFLTARFIKSTAEDLRREPSGSAPSRAGQGRQRQDQRPRAGAGI